MLRKRRTTAATLDEVVELLRGIGTILMEIDAKLEDIARENGDEKDEEETES
jgi:hypothetical protein